MSLSTISAVLLARIEELIGLRGAKERHAVRWGDLTGVYEQAAKRSVTFTAQALAGIPDAEVIVANALIPVNAQITNTANAAGAAAGAAQAAAAAAQAAQEAAQTAQDGADDLRADHDALVAGFTGTLTAAFDQTDGNIDKLRQTVEVTSSDAIFRDTFDGDLSDWENYIGAGEISAVTSSEGVGGKILRLGSNYGNDMVWMAHKHLIPFDPDKTYKTTIRIRQTAGSGVVYAGFAGVAADGVTLVNVIGSATPSSQHYQVILGSTPPAVFTDYTGYTQGRAAVGTHVGSKSDPSKMHTDVAYLRPLIIANYENVAGITEISHFTIVDAVAADLAAKVETQQVALTTATSAIAGLQTSLSAEVTRSALQADDPILAQGLSRWSHGYLGAPEALATAANYLTTQPSTDPLVGGLDFVSSMQAGIYSKKLYQVRPDRKYRIRARAKRVSGSTGLLYLGHVCLNANGSASVGDNAGHKYSAAVAFNAADFPVGDFVEFTAIVSGVDAFAYDKFNAGTEAVRLVALLSYGETTVGASVMALSYFGIEDITEAAQVSAALTTLQGTTASADAALATSITNLTASVQGGLEAAATNWVAQPTVETGTLTGWDWAVIANAPAAHPLGRTKAIRSNMTRHCYAAFPSGSYTRYANLAGRRIRVSGYIYVPAGKGTVYAGLFTYLNGAASYPLATIVGPATARDTWVQFSGEFICDASSSVKMSIWQDEVGGLYDLYLTDVKYEDVTEVAQVNATLQSNYMTSAGTNAAIAAAQTTLQAQIDDSSIGFQWATKDAASVTVGAAVTVANGGIVASYPGSVLITEGATARTFTGQTNGAAITIPAARHILFAGQRVKIGVLAKKAASNGATRFGVAYTCADGNSGYLAASEDLTTSLKWFFFYATVPAAAAAGQGWLGIFGDNGKTGKATQVAKVFIEIGAVAEDIETLPVLGAAVDSILGVDVDALDGTALATLFEQLIVESGTGVSAWVTQQAAAIINLQGNASASYSFRVGAGGAAAGLELVAYNNAASGGAAGSNIKINADYINLVGKVRASDLTISASTTAISPDPGLNDPAIWTYGHTPRIVDVTDGPVGKKALRGLTDIHTSHFACREFAVNPAKKYKLSGWYRRSPEATPGGGSYLRVYWYDQNLTLISFTDGPVSPTTTWQQTVQTNLTPPANARFARLFAILNYAGTGGYHDVQGLMLEDMVDGSLVVNGSIFADHLAVDAVEARHVKSGEIHADHMTIDGNLDLNAQTANLTAGLLTPDGATDGVAFGRFGGAFGFGAARTNGAGKRQSIKITPQTGLEVRNARHYVSGATAAVETTLTAGTALSIALPAGTSRLNLTLQGGGSGGNGSSSAGTTGYAGGSGGNTRVDLYQNGVATGLFWEAAGGVATTPVNPPLSNYPETGGVGQSSSFGSGGAGAYSHRPRGEVHYVNSIAAVGYGAGGGGGLYSLGGNAGALVSVQNYDLSAYTGTLSLVVTVGAAGAASGYTGNVANRGAAGSGGLLKYSHSINIEIPADVLPIRPTAVGSFSKAANATGQTVFPDLGPGLWIIDGGSSDPYLYIGTVEIDSAGSAIQIRTATRAEFISEIRPKITAGMNYARTIYYKFYSMTQWG